MRKLSLHLSSSAIFLICFYLLIAADSRPPPLYKYQSMNSSIAEVKTGAEFYSSGNGSSLVFEFKTNFSKDDQNISQYENKQKQLNLPIISSQVTPLDLDETEVDTKNDIHEFALNTSRRHSNGSHQVQVHLQGIAANASVETETSSYNYDDEEIIPSTSFDFCTMKPETMKSNGKSFSTSTSKGDGVDFKSLLKLFYILIIAVSLKCYLYRCRVRATRVRERVRAAAPLITQQDPAPLPHPDGETACTVPTFFPQP